VTRGLFGAVKEFERAIRYFFEGPAFEKQIYEVKGLQVELSRNCVCTPIPEKLIRAHYSFAHTVFALHIHSNPFHSSLRWSTEPDGDLSKQMDENGRKRSTIAPLAGELQEQ